MAHIPRTFSTNNDDAFDLSQIFIGREQQLDLFQIYLNRWKQRMFNAEPDGDLVVAAPSPDNKIQGLVILLYGRGGFGKSTLLRRYRKITLEENENPLLSKITVPNVIDWEFAVEGKRSLFNPPEGQAIDAAEYFRVLRGQLAIALHKEVDDFKYYRKAQDAVEEAKRQANKVLDSMQKADRFAPLNWAAGEGMVNLIRWVAPRVSQVLQLDNQIVAGKVKEFVGKGAEIGAEQLVHLYAKLQDRLSTKLGDYLDPSLRLGLALGQDLSAFAKDFPLLIFFDTYEEADEGDKLLRMVMAAAGLRVGWVIASRDNLWAGPEQRERTIAMEYGYKEIVPADRAVAVDFNVGGVGAFTPSDIKEYFDLLCQHMGSSPPLPQLTEVEAERLWDATKGVPLAVKIAAGLYLETATVDTITEQVEGKKAIVDQMVRRYLLHARDDQDERAKLYSLAMLRRADSPTAVGAALQLPPEQIKTSYASELSRLQRRYSFIFTEKDEPSLHQEVRHFLRLWLLEHRKEPHIQTLNEHLQATDEMALKELEEHRQYTSLKERLQDDEWVDIYLDRAEQQCWLDPFEGVSHMLPFMIGAAIYYRGMNEDVAKIGAFFEVQMRQPCREWWKWATQSLIYLHSRNPSDEERAGLEKLAKLVSQRCPSFPSPIPDYRKELEAAVWWRLGEAYEEKDGNKAVECYEKALAQLGDEEELRKAAAETYGNMVYEPYKEKKYAECILFLNRAIELKSDDAKAYNNRGLAYAALKDYQRALQDYTQALELDPKDATAYYNRGVAYLFLKNTQQAKADYSRSSTLDPTDVNAAWMAEWAGMGKQRPSREIAERLEKIAEGNPQDYFAYVCRGVALGLRGKLKDGLVELERAISLEPESWDAYFWKGMLCAYYYQGRYEQAKAAVEKALEVELPPVLLMPLYWLEKERPVFFEQYAKPLLEHHSV